MLGWCFSSAHVRHPSRRFILPGNRVRNLASWGCSRAKAAQRHRALRPARATAAGPTALVSQASPVVSNPIRMARRSLLTSACSQAPLAQLAEQRTLNPRVRGSSPWRRTRTDLGFYKLQVIFSCPFCPHVCSTFARERGPSNPGLVKNGPSEAPCGGTLPGFAPLRPADAAPGSLDQWSRPLPRVPGACPESLFPCRHARSYLLVTGSRVADAWVALTPPADRLPVGDVRDSKGCWVVAAGCRRRSKRRLRWALPCVRASVFRRLSTDPRSPSRNPRRTRESGSSPRTASVQLPPDHPPYGGNVGSPVIGASAHQDRMSMASSRHGRRRHPPPGTWPTFPASPSNTA